MPKKYRDKLAIPFMAARHNIAIPFQRRKEEPTGYSYAVRNSFGDMQVFQTSDMSPINVQDFKAFLAAYNAAYDVVKDSGKTIDEWQTSGIPVSVAAIRHYSGLSKNPQNNSNLLNSLLKYFSVACHTSRMCISKDENILEQNIKFHWIDAIQGIEFPGKLYVAPNCGVVTIWFNRALIASLNSNLKKDCLYYTHKQINKLSPLAFNLAIYLSSQFLTATEKKISFEKISQNTNFDLTLSGKNNHSQFRRDIAKSLIKLQEIEMVKSFKECSTNDGRKAITVELPQGNI